MLINPYFKHSVAQNLLALSRLYVCSTALDQSAVSNEPCDLSPIVARCLLSISSPGRSLYLMIIASVFTVALSVNLFTRSI